MTTVGLEKVFSPDPNVGFISHALRHGDAIAAGKLLVPAKTLGEMNRIVFNDYASDDRRSDYETYVAHRRANHPDQLITTYVEFFRERQQGRYTVGKDRFREVLLNANSNSAADRAALASADLDHEWRSD